MTYVLNQTGAELRDHMKRISDTSGWDDPLSTRLWQEVQALDRRCGTTETALSDLAAWAEAYPKSVFLPPDYEKAHQALQAVGMTLDAISADIMRTTLREVGRRARAALQSSMLNSQEDGDALAPQA